jgi:CheY-like chemotaxis protein
MVPNMQVLEAANGKIALDILRAESVDLILMDVQMPEMDGLDATQNIRGWEGHLNQNIPIIALTA